MVYYPRMKCVPIRFVAGQGPDNRSGVLPTRYAEIGQII